MLRMCRQRGGIFLSCIDTKKQLFNQVCSSQTNHDGANKNAAIVEKTLWVLYKITFFAGNMSFTYALG